MLSPQQAKALDEEILAADDGRQPETILPAQIGGYRIIRLIGAGGMGVVYEARQVEPHRVVALKVLRRGVASRRAMKRFRHEVEVLGRLQHSGIAQIYHAATHDDGHGGVPFFVMEYVTDAQPITHYAVQHSLSIRQRLDLFTSACDAVHHGHQKGVLHRDLKPDNILVGAGPDGAACIKVIDFGIARATDSDRALTTVETDARTLLGTLQYMSPEQCEDSSDIDTRSDVYALGIVLYQLLTNHVPYDVGHRSLPSAIRIICETEPPIPSTFRRSLRGDLDTIVLKAINKDRTRRYDSVAQLAEDVRRHLDGDPISEPSPTPWANGAQWIRRHPIAVTGIACLIIASLTVALTTLSVWWIALRPYDLVVSSDRQEARLETRFGHVLRSWTTESDQGIRFAELVERPNMLGGGTLAIIGYSTEAVGGGAPLRAFDASERDGDPVWEFRMQRQDLIHQVPTTLFGLHLGTMVVDVYPDVPGMEIIVALVHGLSSWSAIVVLDLEGRTLYRAWHHGSISETYWLAGPGRLVALANSNDALWPDLGFVDVRRPQPMVLFGLDVARHREGPLIISGTSDVAAWYQFVLPPWLVDDIRPRVTRPGPDEDQSSLFRLDLGLIEGVGSFSVLLDANGAEVTGHRRFTDEWRTYQGPKDHLLEAFHLGPRPVAKKEDAIPDGP